MSQEQETATLVLEQAERLLQRHVTPDRLRQAEAAQWAPEIWAASEDAGLTMALTAEDAGGVGLAPLDAFRLIRLAARHAAPIPLAETMLAQALWAQASGELTPGVLTFGPACVDDSVSIAPLGDGYVLDGQVHDIAWGAQSAHILLQATDAKHGRHLVLLPTADLALESRRNLADEPRTHLVLSAHAVGAEAVRPAGPNDDLLAAGALMRAAQMVGAMERCLELTIDYARERRQFGRPIGAFQAVQQMLADAAGHWAAASAGADLAAEGWGTPRFEILAAIAKSRAGEASGRVAEICHEIFAAIGFTREMSLHFSTRRLWAWRDEFGAEPHWQGLLGRKACAAGGDGLWPLLTDT